MRMVDPDLPRRWLASRTDYYVMCSRCPNATDLPFSVHAAWKSELLCKLNISAHTEYAMPATVDGAERGTGRVLLVARPRNTPYGLTMKLSLHLMFGTKYYTSLRMKLEQWCVWRRENVKCFSVPSPPPSIG